MNFADDVTFSHITIATWDHMPCQAFTWQGAGGTWRQSFFNRITESTFPPFSAPGALKARPATAHNGTMFGLPLTVISGGGAFYDFS